VQPLELPRTPKAAADQLKATKAQTKALQDQAKLNKAKTLFDIDQIQIIAALQGQLTEDEKLRLSLQMALIQGNATEADRLSNLLAASQLKTTNLAAAIANLPPALNPLKDYPTYVNAAISDIQRIQDALNKLKAPVLTVQVQTTGLGGVSTGAPIASGGTTVIPDTSGIAGLGIGGDQGAAARALEQARNDLSNLEMSLGRGGDQGGAARSINVTVQGNVISNKDLADTIRMQLLDSSASGSFTMSNRATRGD
jgi:hypothetical protein